jgi:hypothetical protein
VAVPKPFLALMGLHSIFIVNSSSSNLLVAKYFGSTSANKQRLWEQQVYHLTQSSWADGAESAQISVSG